MREVTGIGAYISQVMLPLILDNIPNKTVCSLCSIYSVVELLETPTAIKNVWKSWPQNTLLYRHRLHSLNTRTAFFHSTHKTSSRISKMPPRKQCHCPGSCLLTGLQQRAVNIWGKNVHLTLPNLGSRSQQVLPSEGKMSAGACQPRVSPS